MKEKLLTLVLLSSVVGNVTFSGSAMSGESVGERLYFKSCAVCHGEDGTGAMPGIRKLGGKGGPLFKSDAELRSVIMKGVKRPGQMQMPAKGGNSEITPDLAQEIIQFMRTEFVK